MQYERLESQLRPGHWQIQVVVLVLLTMQEAKRAKNNKKYLVLSVLLPSCHGSAVRLAKLLPRCQCASAAVRLCCALTPSRSHCYQEPLA